MKLERRGTKVVATFQAINGWDWDFAHDRATEADAANLYALIKQRMESDAKRSEENIEYWMRQVSHLERSNAALRGHLRKARKEAR